jgi:hypothetical protein
MAIKAVKAIMISRFSIGFLLPVFFTMLLFYMIVNFLIHYIKRTPQTLIMGFVGFRLNEDALDRGLYKQQW